MGFAGELSTIGLAEVFQNVAFNRLTGVLTVSERVRKASVLFDDGHICAIRCHPDSGLDYVAIAQSSNAAPADAIVSAASKQRRRRTLKETLAQNDRFSEERFDAAIAAAVREELILLFSWKYASFVFEEERPRAGFFDAEQLGCCVRLDPQHLAMEAARRVDEWETIAHRIESERDIFLPVTSMPEEERTSGLDEILGRLDGTRDLGSVIQELPHGRFHVLRLVADLAERGYVERASVEQLNELARVAEEGGDMQRAVAHLEAALDMGCEDTATRLELVRLYELCGRRNDAAREHKRLAEVQERNGDLEGALDSYRNAATLVPYESDALEKLVDLHEARGDMDEFMRAGVQLAEALTGNRLLEEALDVFHRLIAHDPDSRMLRESLASTYIKLHEPKKAARELLELANRTWDRDDLDRAAHYYRSVLAVDRDCVEATERIAELEKRRITKRRRRHRRRVVLAFVTALATVGVWQGGREWYASRALTQAARAAIGGVVNRAAEDSLVEAISLYSHICTSYPHTMGANEAEVAVRTLLLEELERLRVVMERDSEAALKTLERMEAIEFPSSVQPLWRNNRRRIRERLGLTVSEG